MRILVVDHNSSTRRITRGVLREFGMNDVEEAMDGVDALRKLRTGPFNLVISDWEMGQMSGLDLLKEVRADDNLKKLPFIMVTAEARATYVVAAKQAGVSNYVLKPFNAATLKEKIEAVVGVLPAR